MTDKEICYTVSITKNDILKIIKDHYRNEDLIMLVMDVVDDGFGETDLARHLVRLLTEYLNEVTE